MSLKHETSKKFVSDKMIEGVSLQTPQIEGPRMIQSVVRALDILEVIASQRSGVTLSQLSSKITLNSSTCHHLVSTLVARGYVEHLGRNRGYALGQKLHELVELADSEFDPELLLRDDLKDLGERLGHSVQLAILAETSLLTKLQFPAPSADDQLQEPDELLKMTALHATATGKAILAWLPEIELVRVISANGLRRYTENTITTLSGLIEELRLVRRRGYSVDDEELQSGVVCIGSALRDAGGAIVGSISTTGQAAKMTPKYRLHLSKAMNAAAVDFSKRLRAAKQ